MKQHRKIGIGAEGHLHKQFGSLMKKYEALKRLDCIFWSYSGSGEKRSLTTASLLKAKGLKPGQPDYMFIKKRPDISTAYLTYPPQYKSIDHYIYLEFKKPKTATAKGTQSATQKDFQARFKDSINSRYYIVYSIDEALKVLEKEGILLIN